MFRGIREDSLSRRGALFDEKQVVANQHGFASLIRHLASFDHHAVSRAPRIFSLFGNCHFHVERVADVDRFDEPEPVVPIRHGAWVHDLGGHTHRNAEDEGSVRNAVAEGLSPAPFFVHVVRVEVAGLAGVDHDVGFRDGPPGGDTGVAGLVVLKKLFGYHAYPPSSRSEKFGRFPAISLS